MKIPMNSFKIVFEVTSQNTEIIRIIWTLNMNDSVKNAYRGKTPNELNCKHIIL